MRYFQTGKYIIKSVFENDPKIDSGVRILIPLLLSPI